MDPDHPTTSPGMRVAGGVELIVRIADPPGGEGWLGRQQHARIRAAIFPPDANLAAELGARTHAARQLKHAALSYSFDVFRDARHLVVVSPAPSGGTLAEAAGDATAGTAEAWVAAMRELASGLEALHAARLHHGFVTAAWIHVGRGPGGKTLTLGGVGLSPSPTDLDAAQAADARDLASVFATAFSGWTPAWRRALEAVRTATALQAVLQRFQREAASVARGFRVRLAVVASVALSGLVVGVASTHRPAGGRAAVLARAERPPPVEVTSWGDDFEQGLGGWMLSGEPLPRVVEGVADAKAVFDNNGDGMYSSGALSRVLLEGPDGWEVRQRVLLRVERMEGCHQSAMLSIHAPDSLPHGVGWLPDHLVHVSVAFEGLDCWAMQPSERGRVHSGGFVRMADGRTHEAGSGIRLGMESTNRWILLTARVGRDGSFRAEVDGVTILETAGPVDPRLLGPVHIGMQGRSAGLTGKAYVDSVAWEPFGRGLVHSGDDLPDVCAPVPVPWTTQAWRAEGCTLPDRAGRRLSLETAAGETVRLETLESHVDEPHFLFELTPFLQSGDHDRLTILLREAELGRQAGVRFSAGVVTLVVTRPDGTFEDEATLGTYTPGSPLSMYLMVRENGDLHVTGSRIPGLIAPLARNGSVPVAAEVELEDSADGVLFSTLRIAKRLSARRE